ncbi:MAG: DUF3298 domain-containing protein [Clostridia bacterium]|nr:DUF3298 domain-containing protein [Clostridia bacterium]
MKNDERLRELAQKEKETFEVPKTLTDMVEDTLAELPEAQPVRRPRYWKIPATIAAAFLAVFLLLPNTSYPVARALSEVPVLGTVFQAVTFREYAEDLGNSELSVKTPAVSSEGPDAGAAAAVSEEIDALNEAAADRFRAEHADGSYGALKLDYEVLANTDRWYSVKVVQTEQGADTGTFEDYYTFDKKTGECVILSDLFEKDEYIAHLSDSVKAQMRAQMKADEDFSYFLDSDIPEEDFDEIDPNQDFYFDKDGTLVLCFDSYEVAPGYMGPVTFRIPQKFYRGDLRAEYQ